MIGKKQPVSLAALQGKVVIVHLFATWCDPCKKSFPALEALETKYKKRGLVVVGVSADDQPTGIPAFAKTTGTTFPLVWDDSKQIMGNWRPKTMPTTFVIDRKGIVFSAHDGFHAGDEKALEEEVKKLF